MANYYLDFVGLNTFIYEGVNYDLDQADEPHSKRPSPTNIKWLNVPSTINHFGPRVSGLFAGSPASHDLSFYKNWDFSHELPNTASFFPALMLHRNGPYGWPSWKQIRIGQNPLTRRQIKENIFTHVIEPGDIISLPAGPDTVRSRYGLINAYTEMPVSSRFKPVLIYGGSTIRNGNEKFDIKPSYGNNIVRFNNHELDKYYGFLDESDETYDKVRTLYLDGGLDSIESPIDVFSHLHYHETVYPKQIYTYKNSTRQRTNFIFNWRDDFGNRSEEDVDNGFGTTIASQSMWPLDTSPVMGLIGGVSSRWENCYGLDSLQSNFNSTAYGFGDSEGITQGILQNNYSFGEDDIDPSTGFLAENEIAPAPIYSRKHTLVSSASIVSPNGALIEGISSGTSFGNLHYSASVPGGEATWDAGSQSGKNPFYDSYDEFIDGVRQKGKDYTIIPEFRISNHIESINANGVDYPFSNMFELTGAHLAGSDEEEFYKVYSTTDFLKHFDLVREQHRRFADPTKITLKCKVIKKFLPYDGFYPCQRTVQLTQQFYSSYLNGCKASLNTSTEWVSVRDKYKHAFQNLMVPLFAPGVLFNAIKSGVACDYPIITGSVGIAEGNVHNDSGVHSIAGEDTSQYYLVGSEHIPVESGSSIPIFDVRVPFRSLVEPQSYLANINLSCNEPHVKTNTSSSLVWDGTGDNLYRMMAHNFLAEVPDFFLPGGQFTTLYSRPSSHSGVGNAISGSTYGMRVKMYKTVSGSATPATSGSTLVSKYFTSPQYDGSVNENFTMYSRPTAFGPPSRQSSSWERSAPGSNSDLGENYPFTPPYYYGQSWADIRFTATETKKYSISEIIKNCEVEYWRYAHSSSAAGLLMFSEPAKLSNDLFNNDAMQLSASVELFAQGEVNLIQAFEGSDATLAVAVDSGDKEKSSWVIQSHFETPMLNFDHYKNSADITMPTYASESVPRGMWHQYGRIESDSSKGIFLQVDDIPDRWKTLIKGESLGAGPNTNSLAKMCGFLTEPARLGSLASKKVISEAIVAIPFIEEGNDRKFFKLDPDTIGWIKAERAMAEEAENVAQSIFDMVDKMKKFVIPPSFDFIHRDDIDPFAMYIFEFKHDLSQQDLADIWQNLPPQIGTTFEESTVAIRHDLLAHELLGGGSTIKNKEKEVGPELPQEIKWLVFKAKQRAKTNYYNKVVGEEDTLMQGTKRKDFQTRRLAKQAATMLRPAGHTADISYNWPYDYFSLIELVKMDAKVRLSDMEVVRKEQNEIVLKRGQIAKIPGFGDTDFEEGQTPEHWEEEEIPTGGNIGENMAKVRASRAKRAAAEAGAKKEKYYWQLRIPARLYSGVLGLPASQATKIAANVGDPNSQVDVWQGWSRGMKDKPDMKAWLVKLLKSFHSALKKDRIDYINKQGHK
tara:strand:- start:3262 stop:7473 length:4212 start_codon:yes stop_codon:yes gene_type:complete